MKIYLQIFFNIITNYNQNKEDINFYYPKNLFKYNIIYDRYDIILIEPDILFENNIIQSFIFDYECIDNLLCYFKDGWYLIDVNKNQIYYQNNFNIFSTFLYIKNYEIKLPDNKIIILDKESNNINSKEKLHINIYYKDTIIYANPIKKCFFLFDIK